MPVIAHNEEYFARHKLIDDSLASLRKAVQEGDVEAVKRLLATPALYNQEIPGVTNVSWVNRPYDDGIRAYLIACKNGYPDILKVLLADPRVMVDLGDDKGNTGLHLAAKYNRVENIKLLVKDDRVPKRRFNKLRERPYHVAEKAGHIDVLNIFDDLGIDMKW